MPGRHITNAVLHGLVSAAAFLLLGMLLGGVRVPFGAALLFAAHPAHVDAVDPITGRGDLLAAGFLLAAWAAFRLARQRPRSGPALLAAIALYGAAMLSKESAAVLLGLVLVGEWVAGRGDPVALRERWWHYGALAIALVAYLPLRTAVLGGWLEPGLPDPLDNPLAGSEVGTRLVAVPAVWLQMARLLVWPWPLSADYSGGALTLPASVLEPVALAGWILAVILLAGWVAAARRPGAVFLGLSILVAAVLPASNLLFTAPLLLAARVLYLPSLGFVVMLASPLRFLSRVAAGVALASVALAWSVLTLSLHPQYADDLAVWEQATRIGPGNGKAWYNLGNAHMRRSSYTEAQRAYARATELEPTLAVAWSNLGLARGRAGDEDGATESLLRAVALDPALAQAHAALGSLALRRGDREAARRHLRRSLALDPDGPDAAGIRSLLEWIGESPGPGRGTPNPPG